MISANAVFLDAEKLLSASWVFDTNELDIDDLKERVEFMDLIDELVLRDRDKDSEQFYH